MFSFIAVATAEVLILNNLNAVENCFLNIHEVDAYFAFSCYEKFSFKL